jgi:FMN reductase
MRLVTVAGSARPGSRTRTVAAAAASALAQTTGLTGRYEIIDLSVLARRLLLPEPCAAVEDAVDLVCGADLVIVASPAVGGTYSGLLKVFLDRLPGSGLQGAFAFPILLISSARHSAAVDAHLSPLLAELGAAVPVPGLAVLEPDLARLDTVLRPWAARAAGLLPAGALPG